MPHWRRRCRPRDEAGFTLVEVVVALLLLFVAFTAAAGALLVNAKASGRARHQTAASELATQAMEELRALSFSTIKAGSVDAITADSAVSVHNGTYYYGSEALALNGGVVQTDPAQRTPLNTYPWPTVEMNGTTYEIQTLVTCHHSSFTGSGRQPSCSQQVDDADTVLYHATVIVSWTALGASRSVTTRSYLFSPPPSNACQPNLPIAAPCQAVFSARADTGNPTISGTPIDPRHPEAALPELGRLTGVSLGLVEMAAALQAERTDTASTSARRTPSAWQIGNLDVRYGGVPQVVSHSSDPMQDGSAGERDSLVFDAIQRTIGDSTVLQLGANSASGSQLATPHSQGATTCVDPVSGSQQVTTLPCARSSATIGGARARVDLGDAVLGMIELVSVDDAAQASTAFVGRYAAPGNTRCTGGTAAGCIAAAAKRAIGAVHVAGLPLNVTAPAPWNSDYGMVSLVDYTDEAVAEQGNGAGSSVATATGVIRYWDGSGYATTPAVAAGDAPVVLPVSLHLVDDSVAVSIDGTVRSGTRRIARTGPTDCATRCDVTSTVTSPVIDLDYLVSVDGTQVMAIHLHVDLGQLTASANYTADPRATG